MTTKKGTVTTVSANSFRELEKKVQAKKKLGWSVVGSLSAEKGVFLQLMTKNEIRLELTGQD